MNINDPNNQREDLANDITRYCLSFLITRLKLAYPNLLLTTSTFTPYLTGRGRYNGVTRIESQWDPRQPFELKLLNELGLDFIDLHITPALVGVTRYDIEADLRSAQWNAITLQKPLIIGEIGIPKKDYFSKAEAAKAAIAFQVDSCRYGFVGWIGFPWDDWEGAIQHALAPQFRPDPASSSGISFCRDSMLYE
jgi:hypothetical protein